MSSQDLLRQTLLRKGIHTVDKELGLAVGYVWRVSSPWVSAELLIESFHIQQGGGAEWHRTINGLLQGTSARGS